MSQPSIEKLFVGAPAQSITQNWLPCTTILRCKQSAVQIFLLNIIAENSGSCREGAMHLIQRYHFNTPILYNSIRVVKCQCTSCCPQRFALHQCDTNNKVVGLSNSNGMPPCLFIVCAVLNKSSRANYIIQRNPCPCDMYFLNFTLFQHYKGYLCLKTCSKRK